MRVLFAYRSGDVDVKGGAATVMERTAGALRALGVEADITYDLAPDPAGYDVVHPVNIWAPQTAWEQLRHLRAENATIVWQPFYLHWAESSWAAQAQIAMFDPARPADERERLLAAFTSGQLEVAGMTKQALNEPVPGFHAALRDMLGLVDRLVVCSLHEVQALSQTVGLRGTPFTHTPHGVDSEAFASPDPDAFRRHAGIDGEFILCVGAIDLRKNQLVLARATRDMDIPLVLLGPAHEPDTLARLATAGGSNVVHVERVPGELVASAYHGAAVHVMASYAEGAALVNLEAAIAGTPLVVSNRSSEFEYFGDLVRYCDPTDPGSIRAAIEDALGAREREPERIAALQERTRQLTWERTAKATVQAYEAALADVARRGAANGRPVAVAQRKPVSAALSRFTDDLTWTRRPILDFVQEVAADLEPGTRLFDVGAGNSPYRELFDHVDYVSNDWTHSVHPGARAVDVVGPAHDLPVDDGSFDAVLLTEVLEHTPNPAAVLAELHRVLRPGGRLFMTTPFVWEMHEAPFDFFRYTAWGLDRLARDAGFVATDVRARNDSFATLAQMMSDWAIKMGSYPDGRNGDRERVIQELRGNAAKIARDGRLDARRAWPLGYRTTAWKGPLPERERGPGVDDARGFTTLAYADELLFDPSLLKAYADAFAGGDDATLVIYAPRSEQAELEQRLLELAAGAGLAGDGGADLLALPYPGLAPDEGALAAGVDAVLSIAPPRGAFRFVPHYHQATVDGLRAAAEAGWASR
jgi:glycosyltransferase involved in cell wall biosynthesis/SAM-dependent methyltransferase